MQSQSESYTGTNFGAFLDEYSMDYHDKPTPRIQLMREIERLTDELNLLLVSYEPILVSEGMRNQVETLQYWTDCYRNGLAAADKISKNSNAWISDLCERTKLATDELLRFEDEGGPSATRYQQAQIDQTIRATRQFSRIAPEMDDLIVQRSSVAVDKSEYNDVFSKPITKNLLGFSFIVALALLYANFF